MQLWNFWMGFVRLAVSEVNPFDGSCQNSKALLPKRTPKAVDGYQINIWLSSPLS